MSSESNEMVLDPEAIANLQLLGEEGDNSFLREILTIYLEDVPKRLGELKQAVASEDQPVFTRSAHTIKGSSANVGAREMQELAATLEERSRVEPIASLFPAIAELEQALARTKVKMQELIG